MPRPLLPRPVLPRPVLPTRRRQALPFVAALTLAAAATPVLAQDQGTAEQREACAPDAITLCQDTIPDVAKTTACMQRHFAQLSPKCQREFSAATTPPPAAAAPDSQAAVAPPEPHEDDGLDGYRASIRKECRDGVIDPFTCRNTMSVLGMSR